MVKLVLSFCLLNQLKRVSHHVFLTFLILRFMSLNWTWTYHENGFEKLHMLWIKIFKLLDAIFHKLLDMVLEIVFIEFYRSLFLHFNCYWRFWIVSLFERQMRKTWSIIFGWILLGHVQILGDLANIVALSGQRTVRLSNHHNWKWIAVSIWFRGLVFNLAALLLLWFFVRVGYIGYSVWVQVPVIDVLITAHVLVGVDIYVVVYTVGVVRYIPQISHMSGHFEK